MEIKKVSDLKPDQRNFEIHVKILSMSKPRDVFSSKTGITYSVAKATAGDETGTINLTVWNKLVDKIKEGETYKITSAYTSLFKGYLQLNIGKKGEVKKSNKKIDKINKENDLSNKKHQKKYYPYNYKKKKN
jgi:replication factor A1